MSNALAMAVQSMQNDVHRLDTVSQNMVNIATPGYKRAIPVANTFTEVLSVAEQDSTETASPRLTPILGSTVDLSSGPVQHTGRPWDVAISGDGYFELATSDGQAYSRAGNFRLDNAGRLVSESGFAVQGISGDIVLNGNDATLDHNGNIVQEGEIVGRIKIVRFADPKALFKTPTGLLRPADPANAATETTPELQVGHLESSNVSPMREMVSMMETTRHFESLQKLFQGYDEMLGTSIRKLGEF